MADTEKLNSSVITINGEASDYSNLSETSEDIDDTWGLPNAEVYKLAVRFYKEKEGKAVHVTYKDKLKLVALTKQVSFGPYKRGVSPDVGFLDVVGNDRIKVWQSLGEMTAEAARSEFVNVLDGLCSLFKPYVEAHKREKEEQERKRKEEIERQRREEEEKERQRVEEEAKQRQLQQQQKQLGQELQIRAALNQQTSLQFKQYAEQQFPGNAQQQEELIKQLQEQHFQQYMQQVYQQQLLHQHQYQQVQNTMSHGGNVSQPQQQSQGPALGGAVVNPALIPTQSGNGGPITPLPLQNGTDNPGMTGHTPGEDADEQDNDTNGYLPIAAPSMWTRKDLKDFKESLRKDSDSIIKVGSGETITVRVPTHEDGTCLFWEFATDSYDLAFGVFFEWTIAPSNQVSVHVSESSDEDELEEEEGSVENAGGQKEDVEKGSSGGKKDGPATDEIIPVYRRECHEEVYCGSHMYPGRGVYLLKFDNSYSLWRSKTLYYRVYYTR